MKIVKKKIVPVKFTPRGCVYYITILRSNCFRWLLLICLFIKKATLSFSGVSNVRLTSLTSSCRRRVMTRLQIAIIKLQHIAKDRHEWHELLSDIIHVFITVRDASVPLVWWSWAVSEFALVCSRAIKVSPRASNHTLYRTWHHKHCLHECCVQ